MVEGSLPLEPQLQMYVARDDAASLESSGDDEIVLRVRAPGRAVALTVVLYPGDEEWDCDCGSKERACSHVAAALLHRPCPRANSGDAGCLSYA